MALNNSTTKVGPSVYNTDEEYTDEELVEQIKRALNLSPDRVKEIENRKGDEYPSAYFLRRQGRSS